MAIKKEIQHDMYYVPVHRNFLDNKFPFEWLRIRRAGKFTLTYKRLHPENEEVNIYSDEYETAISSPEKLEKILEAL